MKSQPPYFLCILSSRCRQGRPTRTRTRKPRANTHYVPRQLKDRRLFGEDSRPAVTAGQFTWLGAMDCCRRVLA
jgi:hypothetical protein